jgi:hypothetical protein
MHVPTKQCNFRLPALLGAVLLALFSLGLPTAQAQHSEPAPTVTVAELEDLAAAMED